MTQVWAGEIAVRRQNHWETVYATKDVTDVGWYQADPKMSLELIEWASSDHGSVIDVGGGASLLADRLLDAGFERVAVLDISTAALERAKSRLGEKAGRVLWVVADVTAVKTVGSFDLWHDRAVFHFLTAPEDRRKYVELAKRTIRPGGHLVIGTFALDGPSRCSGLEVRRYDAALLCAEFGTEFMLVRETREDHTTPSGKPQPFMFAVLARRGLTSSDGSEEHGDVFGQPNVCSSDATQR